MPPDEIWSFDWRASPFGAYMSHADVWTAIEQAVTEREAIKSWMLVDSGDTYGFSYPTVAAGFAYSDSRYIASLQERIENILVFEAGEQENYWVAQDVYLEGKAYDFEPAMLTFAAALPDGWTRIRPYWLRSESDWDYANWPEDHDPPTDKTVRRLSDGRACEWDGDLEEWVPTSDPFRHAVDRRTLHGRCRAGDYLSGHLIQDFINALNKIVKVFIFATSSSASIGNRWSASSDESDPQSPDEVWAALADLGNALSDGRYGIITRRISGSVPIEEQTIDDQPCSATATSRTWKFLGLSGADVELLLERFPLAASVEWGSADTASWATEPETGTGTRDIYDFDNHGDPVGQGVFATTTETPSAGDEASSATFGADTIPNQPDDPPFVEDSSGYDSTATHRGYFPFDHVEAAIVDFTPGLTWKSGST